MYAITNKCKRHQDVLGNKRLERLAKVVRGATGDLYGAASPRGRACRAGASDAWHGRLLRMLDPIERVMVIIGGVAWSHRKNGLKWGDVKWNEVKCNGAVRNGAERGGVEWSGIQMLDQKVSTF